MTGIIIPLVKKKVNSEDLQMAISIIGLLVATAEQLGDIIGDGSSKKQWVLEKLDDYNIKISEDEADVLIEAAVYELNSWKNELA